MIGAIAVIRLKFQRSLLARRLLGGAAWSVIGSILSSGITLLTWLLLARQLGKEVYGRFVLIQGTLTMIGVFAGIGIGVVATRYVAELKSNDICRLSRILTLAERTILAFGSFASILLATSAHWMASNILNAPDLSTPLFASAFAVLLSALDSYQKSVLVGFEAMRAFAITSTIGSALGSPIMIMAATNYGLQGAALALPVNAMIMASISRLFMVRELNRSRVPRNAKGSLSESGILWRFALPSLFSGALVAPAHWAAQAFVANTESGYTEVAILGIAMQWFNIILFAPGAIGRVILPILTDKISCRDFKNSGRVLMYAMAINAFLALPLALVVVVLSQEIMNLYGPSFKSDYISLSLAVITAAVAAIQSPIGNMLAATSRMWLGALMNAGWAIVYVGLSFLMANQGATGVIFAMAAAYIAHTIWQSHFAVGALRIDKRFENDKC